MSQSDPAREKVIQAAKRIIATSDEPGLCTAQETFFSSVKEIAEIAIEKGLTVAPTPDRS